MTSDHCARTRAGTVGSGSAIACRRLDCCPPSSPQPARSVPCPPFLHTQPRVYPVSVLLSSFSALNPACPIDVRTF